MAAGQIIGRVSVKVLPDTNDFRKDAERKLSAIEKRLKVEISTTIDMSGASKEMLSEVRKMNQRNRILDSRKIRFHTTISKDGMREAIREAVRALQGRADNEKLKFKAEVLGQLAGLELDPDALKKLEDDLEEWRKQHDPMKIQVHPELVPGSTTIINQRLNYAARPRTVPFLPTINNAALAKTVSALAALSGARVAGDWVQRLGEQLMRLDQSVPIIGSLALAIAGLTGATIAAASNMAALSASLASIAPAALLLPGIIGGFAAGIGGTVVAFKDFNSVLPSVGQRLGELADKMSGNFWSVAKQPISDLVDNLFPAFSAGMQKVSTSLGEFFGKLATSLSGSLDGGVLVGMFADVSKSIDIASSSTDSLANILAILGELGASYLPRLAHWFVDIAKRFSDFLTAAKADGSLQAWVDGAIAGLKNLGSIIASVWRIFSSISEAADLAGGSTLTTMAATLKGIAQVVESPAFQTGLIGVLTAVHEAMDQIAKISGPAVEGLFASLGQTLQNILPTIGTAIGTAVKMLATLFSNPAFSSGISSLFDGVARGIAGLEPAIGPLGTALGQIAQVIGALAAQLGPVIGTVFGSLATALSAILPAVQPLIPVLGGALVQIVQMLSPLLTLVATAIGQILTAIAPLIPIVLDLVMTALKPLIDIVMQVLQAALPPLVAAFQRLATALGPILEVVGEVASVLLAILGPAIEWLAGVILDTLIIAIEGIADVFEGVTDFVMGIWNAFSALFSGDLEGFAKGIQQAWDGLWKIVTGLLKTAAAALIAIFNGATSALRSIWNTCWSAVSSFFSGIWNGIVSFLSGVWNNILGLARGGLSSAQSAVRSGLNAIGNFFESGWNACVQAVSNALTDAVAYVRGLPNRITAALGNLGNLLLNAGRDLISGFINGIRNMFSNVQATLGDLTSRLTDWKGPASLDRVLLVDAGQLIIDGLITGMESRYEAVRRSLAGLTSDIGGTAFGAPSISGVEAPRMAARMAGALAAALDAEGGGVTKVLNYHAAPGNSLDSEDDLFRAIGRARAGW